MQYRKMGKSGAEVPILGFGAMRLPVLDKDTKKIYKVVYGINIKEVANEKYKPNPKSE